MTFLALQTRGNETAQSLELLALQSHHFLCSIDWITCLRICFCSCDMWSYPPYMLFARDSVRDARQSSLQSTVAFRRRLLSETSCKAFSDEPHRVPHLLRNPHPNLSLQVSSNPGRSSSEENELVFFFYSSDYNTWRTDRYEDTRVERYKPYHELDSTLVYSQSYLLRLRQKEGISGRMSVLPGSQQGPEVCPWDWDQGSHRSPGHVLSKRKANCDCVIHEGESSATELNR